jgi:Vitamin K-dependent gamma-carboxylase
MTEPAGSRRSTVDALVSGWSTFWFAPGPAYPLGLVRMAFGALVVVWTLALLPDLHRVFGAQGVAPQYPHVDYQWSVFELWPGDTALLVGWVVLLLAAIAMTVGWHGRFAAIVVFVLIHSFQRRGAYLFNAGDTIIVVVALILALSCCNAALSLDQRRRTGSFWSAETLAPWPIRLMQLELTLIYLVSVQAKLSGGKDWVNGTAAFYTSRTDGRWALLEPPDWLFGNPVLVNVATWGTLLLELAIAVLVWNKSWRFRVLAAGVVLHLTLMATMNVGFFSLAMFVLYLAFVPADAIQAMPARVTTWWRDRRRSEPPITAQAPDQSTSG